MKDVHAARGRLRLPSSHYADVHARCLVTFNTLARRKVFDDAAVAAGFVDVLHAHAAATCVVLHAYSVMPDHVHLLITPSARCDIVRFVGEVKNLGQRDAWRRGVVGAFWQKRFHDRFLRQENDLLDGVRYVLLNPVKAGLVRQWPEHPFTGSRWISRDHALVEGG